MKLAVLGANGRMGRRVIRLAHQDSSIDLVAAIGRPSSPTLGIDAGTLAGVGPIGLPISEELGEAEVVVDFALPAATLALLPRLDGRALVTGVTGLDADQQARLDAYDGPLLHAANFSTGVNVLLALVARAAQALPEHHLEVVEAHHGRKRDAPSGTALALARAAAEARGLDLDQVRRDGRVGHTGVRDPHEIGLHAIRAGGIVGEHEVWIASDEEVVRIAHSAANRDTFAAGALRAAHWIHGRPPGRYTMRQVLGI